MEVAPMKRLLLLVTILVAGCAQQQSDQLTQQQKDQIKSDVKAVLDSILARVDRLDPGWADYYVDSPDWGMANADGSRWDYKTFVKNVPEAFKTMTSYKWITTRQDFSFMTKDMVICAWDGKDETIMDTGDKVIYDPHAMTAVFKKIAGQWKIVYSHDSGNPVMQKAGKK
jgi:hypothetical protein